jgi:outer membrane lipoprotein-sorting protein
MTIKTNTGFIAGAIVYLLLVAGSGLAADELTGREIMATVRQTPDTEDMSSDVTMTLLNARGQQRVREIRMLSKESNGISRSVMFFTAPADVRGTGFLTVEQADGESDMWLYLPALRRIRRIVSSSRNESFMGSDLTYADLEPRDLDNYEYSRLADDQIDGEDAYVVEVTPATDEIGQETGYSRTVVWVSIEKLIPLRTDFYDRRGTLAKQMFVEQTILVGGHWVMSRIVVANLTDGGSTIMETTNVEIDTGIDDDVFTQQQLRRGL